jgi:hypothetical protein
LLAALHQKLKSGGDRDFGGSDEAPGHNCAAVNSIDAAREAAVQQVSSATAQQRSSLVHTKEEVLARVEDQLTSPLAQFTN